MSNGLAVNNVLTTGVKYLVKFPVAVVSATVFGTYKGMRIGALEEVAKIEGLMNALPKEEGFFSPIFNAIQKFWAHGFKELRLSVFDAFKDIKRVGINGLAKSFNHPKLTLFGFGALGLAVVGMFLVGKFGWDVNKSEAKITDELDRGHSGAHPVNNMTFHFIRRMAGWGMLGGAIISVIPGGFVLGGPLALASTAVAGGMHILGEITNGFNFLNYPSKLGFFGRRAVGMFKDITV